MPVVDSWMCFGVTNLEDFVTRFRAEGEMVFSKVVVDFIVGGLPAIAKESFA